MERPALSVVSTMYRSAGHLPDFVARVTQSADATGGDWELVLVNDGSPDASLELAISFQRQDQRVRVVDLSRNFGHHRAMMTGLRYARGERVLLIDCDLEEDPALLAPLQEEMRRTGADVVYGVQAQRKGGTLERWTGSLFFALFNALSTTKLPANVTTLRLMTRRYVASLLEHQEREMVISGLWALTGYEQVPLVIEKRSRRGSSYDLGRKLVHLINAVTSFSDRPLVFIFWMGLLIVIMSAIAASYLVIRRIFFGVLLSGWPSMMVSIWLLGGLTLFSIGVVGIYLSRVFVETKRRPYTIVRAVYERLP
jgi:putative glycosyltransferase